MSSPSSANDLLIWIYFPENFDNKGLHTLRIRYYHTWMGHFNMALALAGIVLSTLSNIASMSSTDASDCKVILIS